MLLASNTSPDLREIVIVDQPAIEFRASVLSEDADVSVKVFLLIDYGVTSLVDDRPYLDAELRNKEVPPGTLTDGPRDVVAKLFPDQIFWGVPQAGCHTVTMMVSHNFDAALGCPVNLEDSSQLTWQVIRCDAPCVPDFTDFDPRQDCPKATTSCPASTLGGGL